MMEEEEMKIKKSIPATSGKGTLHFSGLLAKKQVTRHMQLQENGGGAKDAK